MDGLEAFKMHYIVCICSWFFISRWIWITHL